MTARSGRARAGITTVAAVALGLGLLLGGCHSGRNPQVRTVPGGSADQGKRAIEHFGCGSCHTIPGVKGANGLVGPPLIKFSRRGYIAGMLPNTANNLEHWIQDPQSVVRGNDMPNLGVSASQARDITAYLYTLG